MAKIDSSQIVLLIMIVIIFIGAFLKDSGEAFSKVPSGASGIAADLMEIFYSVIQRRMSQRYIIS